VNTHEVKYPNQITSKFNMPPVVSENRRSRQEVTAEIMAGRGDSVPVSKMPENGRFPLGHHQSSRKRNIAVEIPVWDESLCIQCGRCSLFCRTRLSE